MSFHEILKSKYTLKFTIPFSAHMFKISNMAPESFFEWCLKSSAMSFTFIVGLETFPSCKNWCKLFIVQRTLICNFALASKTFFAGIQNLFFVWQRNRFHVSHTKITYFNRFTGEYFESFRNVLSTFVFTLMETWKKLG